MSFKVTLKQYLPEEKAEETRFLEIDKNKINIGTGAGNELQIEGLGISINHASIEKEGEDYYLTDLGSGEDTYLNNERISGKAKLENDYIIKIGSFTFKFLKPETQEEPANINVFKEYKEESKEDEVEIPEISLTFFSRFRLVKSKVNKTNLSLVLIILFFLICSWFYHYKNITRPTSNA